MRRGGKVDEVCEMVEAHGSLNWRALRAALPHIPSNHLSTYAARAKFMGMLWQKDGTYYVEPGWRAITQPPPRLAPKLGDPLDGPLTTSEGIYPKGPRPIASVWELGIRAGWMA